MSALINSSLSSTNVQEKPSVFLLIAAEGLRNTISQSVGHLLRFLCHRYPERLGQLSPFEEEIFLLFDLALQWNYLSVRRSLFSEDFYGLYRTPIKKNVSKFVLRSLVLSAIFPYLKRKLDKLFESQRDAAADGHQLTNVRLQISRKYFLTLYPYIHAIHDATNMAFFMSYLFGHADTHNLLLWLAGAKLEYQTAKTTADAENRWSKLENSGGIWGKMAAKIVRGTAMGLTVGLEVAAFSIQFLDWWYSSESNATSNLTSLPIPPFPSADMEISKTKCPICRGPRRHETLLSTTGYVFCYSCIVQQLRSQGVCPVTKYPAKEDSLVRIYSEG